MEDLAPIAAELHRAELGQDAGEHGRDGPGRLAREGHRELLAAPARPHVLGAEAQGHELPQGRQHAIAREVPVYVVHALEVVEVDEAQAEDAPLAVGGGQPRADLLEEAAAQE